ncbi:alpha-L-fucosidase [Mucilaginibacter rubeus]|uniref:alpha-L-fucosidase n=1 Tax=Mucilaginibacter rubeus TaxID=2027860 RepID=A0AAE6JAW2_9SPHI|nr:MULTISPECIES: alpha-L-fucosidase [Mucilaginibacter]QEM02185.1 alpha-L-fucosidase [Mucilaginibacter rubeus]QEM14813.1 alpha-L-fucosidase [Mucilaginibacter gossypii]QTE42479.1 alpha-L-fucosidase [Mucilaginibacter rubeus]QTE49082.1 alpha-L-fucosidase [Mucilaginibacter rubeus]QTE54180.1 alpha-L-fucosidase [Mucilaginibacter rubeus]
MIKKLLLMGMLLGAVSAGAQTYTPTADNLAARQNFQDMKFGLFIHWGIYSELGAGEWVMNEKHIPYDSYKRLADFFNPQAFNAHDWVMFAKKAGMKYIIVTSRHHDGFSMFGTKASPYNIVDATPYHKDPLMELAQECVKEGIELHFYYSLLDWGRKDYAYGSPIVDGKPANGDWDSYINFMKAQLTELITKYPGVKGIWFDGHWERDVNWHYDEIYGLIHKLNPAILVGNNHHLEPKEGEDFQMFEKDLPGANTTGFSGKSKIGALPLETCETINNSWGFNINDRSFKSSKRIIHYLVNAAGLNANFLLNIGPMPNGKIQPEFTDTLAVVGAWVQKNGEAIYGTRGSGIPAQPWGVITRKDKKLYVHVMTAPQQPYIFIPQLKGKVTKAALLADGSAVKFKQQTEGVFVYLSGVATDPNDTIIKLITN